MPPLPDYYLNYFLEQLNTVVRRYGDLILDEDRLFVDQFNTLTKDASRLYVRLILRKGPFFFVDALNYTEVQNSAEAVEELVNNRLIYRNPEMRAVDIIKILPIAQSRMLFSPKHPKCLKRDLINRFEADEQLKTPSKWGTLREIISPIHYEVLRRLNLLYFGNEHQHLTDFVLEDLGMLQFETLSLDSSNRLFSNIGEVQQYIRLNDLRAEYHQMEEQKEYDRLPNLGDQVLATRPGELLTQRWAKLANRIAYRLEQLGEIDKAIELFSTNVRPPSRERQCRIEFKKGNYDAALTFLESIKEDPKSTRERAFYHRFVNRVYNRLGRSKLSFTPPVYGETHVIWPKGKGTVEELACVQIPGAIWRENQLPLGIFGLIFWQVIFADIKGAWHHRFQSAPSDLYDINFVSRRRELIDQLMGQSHRSWRKQIESIWNEKNGIQNPFVHWHTLQLDELLTCFDALSQEQWRGLFEHLLVDIKHHRSGFPDLFVYDEQGGRFIEIKGPGDRLQDNQVQWLEVFHKLHINVEVCYVQYENE